MTKTLRVGSRDSRLAVLQAQLVISAIQRSRPDLEMELVAMKTTGDRILDKTLDAIGGKGLFVKELDEALLSGRVDICVHSYKDMPAPDNPQLPVVAVSHREDARDVLILPEGRSEPDTRLPVGSASQRRRLQLAALFPEWRSEPIRGNLQTRLRKLDEGLFGGIVLAAAGIKRLGLWSRVSRVFSPDEILPAACQGILAIQGRAGEDHSYLDGFGDADALDASSAERAFIEALEGGCSAPTAAYAVVNGSMVSLSGLHVGEDGVTRRGALSGSRDSARALGAKLAQQLKTGAL